MRLGRGRAVDNAAGRSRSRPWRSPDHDSRRRAINATVAQAPQESAKHWRSSMRVGAIKLRIQTKKLRYAVEFFASLFASKRAAKRRKQLLPALERLQDGLGELNDIAVDEERISGNRHPRGSNPNRAFAAGLLTARRRTDRSRDGSGDRKHMRNWPKSSRSGDDAAADCSTRDY